MWQDTNPSSEGWKTSELKRLTGLARLSGCNSRYKGIGAGCQLATCANWRDCQRKNRANKVCQVKKKNKRSKSWFTVSRQARKQEAARNSIQKAIQASKQEKTKEARQTPSCSVRKPNRRLTKVALIYFTNVEK